MAETPKTVTVKFCGGCNPGYDRVAAADAMIERLAGSAQWVFGPRGVPDVVVAVCGCDCACADLSGFPDARVLTVTSAEDAADIVKTLETGD